MLEGSKQATHMVGRVSLQEETTVARLTHTHTKLQGGHQGNHTTPFEDAQETRKVIRGSQTVLKSHAQ